MLTVTDGTHTARIALTGDYLSSTFVASIDGHAGAEIVDPTAPQSPMPPGLHPRHGRTLARSPRHADGPTRPDRLRR